MMSSPKFIPELHDIGKLIDEKVKDELRNRFGSSWRGHVFVDIDFQKLGISQPTSPSWWAQYHHICYDNNNKTWTDCDRDKLKKKLHTSIVEIDFNCWDFIPQNFGLNLFLLILADHLASSVSRAVGGRGPSAPEGIWKLWNQNYHNSQKKERKNLGSI